LANTRFQSVYNYIGLGLNLKFGEMEFGEMKQNTSNWAIFACFYVARVWQRQLGFLVYRMFTVIL